MQLPTKNYLCHHKHDINLSSELWVIIQKSVPGIKKVSTVAWKMKDGHPWIYAHWFVHGHAVYNLLVLLCYA